MSSSSKQVIPGKKHSQCQSLCLSCSLAYGHLCFVVPFTDRDWVLIYEERTYAGSHEPYIIRSVIKCSRYERTSERKPEVRCRESDIRSRT